MGVIGRALNRITTGTIVDATIIHAHSSTKNSSGEREPVSLEAGKRPPEMAKQPHTPLCREESALIRLGNRPNAQPLEDQIPAQRFLKRI